MPVNQEATTVRRSTRTTRKTQPTVSAVENSPVKFSQEITPADDPFEVVKPVNVEPLMSITNPEPVNQEQNASTSTNDQSCVEVEKIGLNSTPTWFTLTTIGTIIYLLYTNYYFTYPSTMIGADGSEQPFPLSHKHYYIFQNVLIIAALAAIYFNRDTYLQFPHRYIWRISQAYGFIYLIILVCLFTFSRLEVFGYLNSLFSDISNDAYQHKLVWDMNKDCGINANTLWRQFSSIWMFSHVAGWLAKMLMLRDWTMCMFQSILFEFLEITFQFLIPDFRECWWDSIFIDAIIANMGGMLIGYIILKSCNAQMFNWFGVQKNTSNDKNQPLYSWAIFNDPVRMVHCITITFFTVALECTCFFLMYQFHIPPSNPIVKSRMFLLFLLSMTAGPEYYKFVQQTTSSGRQELETSTDSNDKQLLKSEPRLGVHAALAVLIVIIEICICFKMHDNMYPMSPPPEISMPWILCLGFYTLYVVLYFIQQNFFPCSVSTDGGDRPAYARLWNGFSGTALDILYLLAFIPLLTLLRLWAF